LPKEAKTNSKILGEAKAMIKNFFIRLGLCFLICGLLLDVSMAETEEIGEPQKGFTQEVHPEGKSYEAFQHFINGDLYELSGDIEKAISEYQKARTQEPDVPEIRLALARAYFMVKEIDSAKVELLKIEPKNNEAYGLLGDCYRFSGKEDSALLAYQEAVKLDSTDFKSFWQLAIIWQKRDELQKSIGAWRQVASLSSFSAPVHLQLASLLFEIKNYEEATLEYQKVLDLSPNDIKALSGLGACYEAKGEPEKAIEPYEKFLTLDPANENLRNRLISLYLGAGKIEEATKEAELLYNLKPEDVEMKKNLGALYFSQKEYDKAESLFTSYVQSNPDDPSVHFYLGKIAIEKKDFEKAKGEFEKTISLADSVPDGWVNLALIYLLQDSTQKAISVYKEALEKVSDKATIQYLLGSAYTQDRQFDSAIVVLLSASDQRPNDTYILFGLGSAYERRGDFDQAVTIFERLLLLDSTNASALNYLGYMLADKGIRLEESLKMIEKALEYEPNNGAYLDSYGWVLYKLGKVAEAEAQIKKALKIVGDDAIIHEHLGDIYNALGETKKAKKEWKEALKLEPENAKLKEKLK
jgi:tetratricopeptide (TPR) repeat protein